MATAKNTLADKNLPTDLAEVLNYGDADSCGRSIEIVKKAFQKAVEVAIEERLKGGTPMTKAPENTHVTKELFSKMGYAERLEVKTDNPELYKQLSGK